MPEPDNLPVPVARGNVVAETAVHQDWLPAVIEEAGPKASRHFVEFFAVPIGNRHMRRFELLTRPHRAGRQP
jgi:hypothetical protein